ncbi:hypothetical protein ABUW04_33155 [Streptacidiphilus sp. N1-10]|uniref:Uncharacterized protein n=1 Tax=Streptacidiphilus jeojiensis TaxID=3229225 RepID=A0ABV6XYR8_9ACTN
MNGFEDGGDTPHSGPGDDGAPAGEPDPVLAQLMPPDPVDPPGRRGFFSRRRNIAVVAGAAVLAVGGGIAIGVVVTAGSSNTTAGAPSGFKGGKGRGALGAGESGSNARSVNEPGGTSGTVSSVSGTGFTVTTPTGGKIPVSAGSSTAYRDATSGTPTAASADTVKNGVGVLVFGTVNNKSVTATTVTVEPAGSPYTTASSDVSALQRGQKSGNQAFGTIPADYSDGLGTIVGAATADLAVAAALAKYPGGLIDRVVQLSDGGYEVHNIGTTMHHIFEDSTFKVTGAN